MLQCVERSWKNRDVLLPSINIAINIACMLGKVPSAWAAAFILPLRALNTLGHYRVGPRLIVESHAFALQFDPIRRVGTTIIDILSASMSYGFRPDEKPREGEKEGDWRPRWGNLHERMITVAYRLIKNRIYNTISTIGSGCVKIANKVYLLADITMAAEAAVREVVEIAGEKFSKAVVEEAAKEVAEATSHEVAKRIPFFSIAVSIMLAFHRFSQGQFWRGMGEIASGAASCIPVYGTMTSLGLDVVLMSVDIKEAVIVHLLSKDLNKDLISALPLDLPGAYWILGIDPKTTPSQKEVEDTYRQFYDYVYSQKLRDELFMVSTTFPDGTKFEGFSDAEMREHEKLLRKCKDALAKVREILDLENRRVQANTLERMRIFFRWGCFHWKTV